jgi:hypothetical protein
MKDKQLELKQRKGLFAQWIVSDWLLLITILGGTTFFIFSEVRRVDALETRMAAQERLSENIIMEMRDMKAELKADIKNLGDELRADNKATSDLLHADLAWRYLYQHDKLRQHLVPRYDPINRTLEFVPKNDSIK